MVAIQAWHTVRERMKDLMLDWSSQLRNRTAISEEQMKTLTGKSARQGILIGFWKESDVPEAQKPPSAWHSYLV